MPFKKRDTEGGRERERGKEKEGGEREGWREEDGETGRKRLKTTVIPVQSLIFIKSMYTVLF